METKLVKIHQIEESQEEIEEAARLIQQGEVVAFPTETVYGLGGNGLMEEAVRKIYQAKGRPSDNPLILHISDIDMIEELTEDVPDTARKAMECFWPGPMTVILKKSDKVPRCVTGGLETVAVRMPSDPTARELIRRAEVPIAAPSCQYIRKAESDKSRACVGGSEWKNSDDSGRRTCEGRSGVYNH